MPVPMADRPSMASPLRSLLADMRAGRCAPEALAEEALERAEASGLGSYREIRGEAARREATAAAAVLAAGRDPGPLLGVPVSIKDLYGLPGSRTFAGTVEALPERFERAGPVVANALAQLAVVTGKTHTVELAFGGIGMNSHWGTPRNPHDPKEHRVPGGSSSGAGTSLCEGSAKIAFGTDTAGSVRIPAAWTGQVGVKTTKGRWSTEGIVPLSTTLDTPGVLAGSVDDAVVAFAALDGPAAGFPDRLARIDGGRGRSVRLAVPPQVFWEDCSPGVAEAVEAAVARIAARPGVVTEERGLGGLEAAEALFGVGGPTAIELHRFLDAELPDRFARLDPLVRDRVAAAGDVPAGEYIRRLDGLAGAHRAAMASFGPVDAFLTPTVAITPPPVSTLSESLDAYRRQNVLTLRNPGLVSFLGLCAVSLPCGRDRAGMPVGLQIVGPAGSEERLLSLAADLEATALG